MSHAEDLLKARLGEDAELDLPSPPVRKRPRPRVKEYDYFAEKTRAEPETQAAPEFLRRRQTLAATTSNVSPPIRVRPKLQPPEENRFFCKTHNRKSFLQK